MLLHKEEEKPYFISNIPFAIHSIQKHCNAWYWTYSKRIMFYTSTLIMPKVDLLLCYIKVLPKELFAYAV